VNPMDVYSNIIQSGWLKGASLDRTRENGVRIVRLFDVLCQSLGFLELGSRCALETADRGAAVHCRIVFCLQVLVELITSGKRDLSRLTPVWPHRVGTSIAGELTSSLDFGHRLERARPRVVPFGVCNFAASVDRDWKRRSRFLLNTDDQYQLDSRMSQKLVMCSIANLVCYADIFRWSH
jgi:hypothetical protein